MSTDSQTPEGKDHYTSNQGGYRKGEKREMEREWWREGGREREMEREWWREGERMWGESSSLRVSLRVSRSLDHI